MYLYRLMCVDELIEEANATWEQSQGKYSFLDKYRDCRHFFDRAVGASLVAREEILSRLWDGCHGRFNRGVATLMILLCHQEFKEVFNRKVKFLLYRDDKLQLFQIMVDILLTELAKRKTSIIALRNHMNSKLESIRKRLLKENALFSPIEFLENIAVSDAVSPSALMDSRDYHEVWDLIERHISDQKQIAWVKWLVVNNAYIPGFDESPQAPNLSSQEKCEIRDKIADAIKSEIPRLVSFVKEKQKGKRRRSYECL